MKRVHIICDRCGKGRYRRQRRYLDHHFCSPTCYQAYIKNKKWKKWKHSKPAKKAYQNKSEIEDIERAVEYIEEWNKWNHYWEDDLCTNTDGNRT
jgi:hypothetical protein